MSGDSKRNEEPDFLDDDFVVEDLAGKNDDLEQLFDDPGAGAPAAAKAAGAPDSDDVLFTDHTKDAAASEQFGGSTAFSEENKSTWQGEQLELGGDEPRESDADKIAAASAAFSEELGAGPENDEELPLDSEKELELVDQPSADEVKEFEQSGAFVLEEGDRAWQEQTRSAKQRQPAVEPEVAEGIWEAVKDPAMAETAGDEAVEATQEPGWEALPESNVDQLSEVDGVEESAEPVPAEGELAAVDGHDIYGDDAPALVGARGGRSRRSWGVAFAMAASLALVGGAAVIVMRPEWVGLRLEGERVQQVMVDRPRIDVAVATPPAVAVTPRVAAGDPGPTRTPTDPQPVAVPDPVAMTPDPAPGVPFGPEPPPDDPVAATTTEPIPAPRAVAGTDPGSPVANWPQPMPTPGPKPLANSSPRAGKGKKDRLVRIGDNTMLGGAETDERAQPRAVEGMLPGTRAFAQLHNGNYFIGSIKDTEAGTVTLRLDKGEVTLEAAEIMRITPLGSADYEALQRATAGFVRLTNNNRLVGGILSQIADDHIVLEFRSNRVMLPKAVVGSVVQGENEQAVRLDMTPAENDWVRSLAEREIGSLTPGPAAPSPKGASTPIEGKVEAGSPTVAPPSAPRTPAAPPRQR